MIAWSHVTSSLSRVIAEAGLDMAALVVEDKCAGCGGALSRWKGPCCSSCDSSIARAGDRRRCEACSLPVPTGARRCTTCARRASRPRIVAPRVHAAPVRELVWALKYARRREVADALAALSWRDQEV